MLLSIPAYHGRKKPDRNCGMFINRRLQNGIIKKHENTREEKELDRIRHVEVTNAHTGPIFLAYRRNETLAELMEEVMKEEPSV